MEVRRIKGWAPDDALEHHGIKGQRWGKRNYQNTDGSLTTAGKLRYAKGNRGVTRNTTFEIQSKKGKEYSDSIPMRNIRFANQTWDDYLAYRKRRAMGEKNYWDEISRTDQQKYKEHKEIIRNTHKDQKYAEPQTINGVFYPGTEDKITLDKIMSEKYGENWKEHAENGEIAYDITPEGLRDAKTEQENAERSYKYKKVAQELERNHHSTVTYNKKFSTKAKRFVDSFKEVHTENIDKTKKGFKKAVKAVKNYFNLKMP